MTEGEIVATWLGASRGNELSWTLDLLRRAANGGWGSVTNGEMCRAMDAVAAALEAQAQREGDLRLMATRWDAEADGVEAAGYSQQADRIRECARELRAALSPAGTAKEEDRG
jgi:hypothetical protein